MTLFDPPVEEIKVAQRLYGVCLELSGVCFEKGDDLPSTAPEFMCRLVASGSEFGPVFRKMLDDHKLESI